jgi:ABC-2 type transport system ATP-binding protein
MIKVNHATLTYRSGKVVFDLDFKIGQGQVMGYLGPNGAGKTTTIRQLTGFMKSD